MLGWAENGRDGANGAIEAQRGGDVVGRASETVGRWAVLICSTRGSALRQAGAQRRNVSSAVMKAEDKNLIPIR